MTLLTHKRQMKQYPKLLKLKGHLLTRSISCV
uniref:Uncharacterized protein n=1 Tax=Anguilla anguilla TaxID=7936 RepID=A0A0E9QVF8_ANGAN